MSAPNDLILYHYNGSPYAKRIVWYLALRGISYAECIQPMVLPRPDLEALNVKYRRIPVLAHGRHVYCDTRGIINHLEQAFPATAQHPSIYPPGPFEQGFVRLLSKWIIEAGIFDAAAATLPVDLPALKDPRFRRDREQLSGRSWERASVEAARPSAMLVLREGFLMLEEQLLGDGREWALGGDAPSIADIEAVWPFWWTVNIPGALDPRVISAERFPKAFAWIKRFDEATKTAAKKAQRPARIKGQEATKLVLGSNSQPTGFRFDVNDPIKLKIGDIVEAFPSDSGSANKDTGRLVGLDEKEAVLETKAPGGEIVYIHHPRTGFRVRVVGNAKL